MNELLRLMIDSFPKILIPGLTMTLPLTAIAFSCAMVIAVAAALVQFANVWGLKHLARFYIWIFRGTPLLVQLYVIFFGLPRVGVTIEPFPAAVLVFSLNEGAYCAETVRAALESVPPGQLEAGLCAGMSYLQTMGRIILPQAMRTAFPPLSNSLIAMVKDTSLAQVISIQEVIWAGKAFLKSSHGYKGLLWPLFFTGVYYLVFNGGLTLLFGWVEKKLDYFR